MQADDSSSYPVISIKKFTTPDNLEIYEAEINGNNSPQETKNQNSKYENSFDTIGYEINEGSTLPESDLVKDVNKNSLHRQMHPIDMHYHKHGSGLWPGFNHRFDSKWRPGGREWPSHNNFGYHHRPYGHQYHNGHNNHGSWSNDGHSPDFWNCYHDHNKPNNYRPPYYERPNNHEHFYHNHPYQPYFHNNHNNEHPYNYDNRPSYNKRPSENNETNNPQQSVFNNNSNNNNIDQQTEIPISNNNDEDLINPITNAPPPLQPQTEVPSDNKENLDQLFTEIFGVPTTTEVEFSIDQRIKDDSDDAPVYEENTSQVNPVRPES